MFSPLLNANWVNGGRCPAFRYLRCSMGVHGN